MTIYTNMEQDIHHVVVFKQVCRSVWHWTIYLAQSDLHFGRVLKNDITCSLYMV